VLDYNSELHSDLHGSQRNNLSPSGQPVGVGGAIGASAGPGAQSDLEPIGSPSLSLQQARSGGNELAEVDLNCPYQIK
jgi:hypothetical protein